MCGIIARFGNGSSGPFPLASAIGSIVHRGPDAQCAMGWDEGEKPSKLELTDWSYKNCILGHTRLAIIDRGEHADQPLVSRDRRWFLSFNGEIYNYVELREELVTLGAVFRTDSDTEVFLQAWQIWGKHALNRFEGMFAFLLFDSKENYLYVGRDPFGIKPLFVSESENELIFCSELSFLKDYLSAFPDRLDGIAQCLRWGMNDGQEHTIFGDIRRVPPGAVEVWELTNRTQKSVSRYFDPSSIVVEDWSFSEAKEALRTRFLISIERHLRSDAPLGFALSGGIDSSAIVCAAHALGYDDITTFSYIPRDPKLSELDWIDIVVRHVGARSHLISPSNDRIEEILPDVVRIQGEPFASLSIVAQHEVYERVSREGITVLLSGQGADELLAGYTSYYQKALSLALANGRLREALHLGRQWPNRFGGSHAQTVRWLLREFLPTWIRSRAAASHLNDLAPWLNIEAFRESGFDNWTSLDSSHRRPPTIHAQLAGSIEHSLVALLRYDDRNSMAHSVESRVPFLTPELAQLCLSFPDEFLIDSAGRTKHIFREAMTGIVPEAILQRSDKMGFAPDGINWSFAITEMHNKLEGTDLCGFVNRQKLEKELAGLRDNGATRQALAWRTVNCLALAASNHS